MKQKTTSVPLLQRQFNFSSEISEIISEEHINQEAKACGFFKRVRKLLPFWFVQLCCFWDKQECFPSLKRQCQWLLEKHHTEIRDQSLNERFTRQAMVLMQKILGKISSIKAEEKLKGIGEMFTAVFVFDSTIQRLFPICEKLFKGCGGGGSTSGIKIQFGLDLLTGNTMHLSSGHAKNPDLVFKVKNILRGSLLLFDLGYFKTSFLAKIARKKAFFLCRYRFSTVVYVKEEDGAFCRLDLMKIMRKMEIGQLRELEVFLGVKEKTPVRLIIEKLPKSVADGKRRKLKYDLKSKRKRVSKARLEFCNVNVWVTNVSKETLRAPDVRTIYALRWQIEIVFKTWKSIFGLKQVTEMNPYRLSCIYFGTLIRILIATRVFWIFKVSVWNTCGKELSEIIAMKILAERIDVLLALMTFKEECDPEWERLKKLLITYAIKRTKRKNRTPLQILKLFRLT